MLKMINLCLHDAFINFGKLLIATFHCFYLHLFSVLVHSWLVDVCQYLIIHTAHLVLVGRSEVSREMREDLHSKAAPSLSLSVLSSTGESMKKILYYE